MKSAVGYGALTGVSAPAFSVSGLFGGSNRGIAIGDNTSVNPRVHYIIAYAASQLKPGELWTWQHKIKKIGTFPAGGQVYPAIRWQLVGGGEIVNVTPTAYVENGSGWMQCVTSARVPSNCNGTVQLNIGFLGIATNLDVTGDVGWADCCFERGGFKPYFDGSTPSTSKTKYSWLGAADSTESIASEEVSLSDSFATDLKDQGYSGSVADMERQRLLQGLSLAEPQNLSLSDLYRLKNERPRVF